VNLIKKGGNMKKYLVCILVLVTVFMLIGCDSEHTKEYDINAKQLDVFQNTQPIPQISFSNTREAVIKRIARWNDPNKISYIYLINYGRVMAFYTVKGSVESKRSYLSPTLKPLRGCSGVYPVVDAPDVDGTADSVFFFNTDDVYVEWSGDYMWVDQPLKLATQPDLMYVAPLK
jgi:hypothetical protein